MKYLLRGAVVLSMSYAFGHHFIQFAELSQAGNLAFAALRFITAMGVMGLCLYVIYKGIE